MPYGPRKRFRAMRKRTKSATKIQALVRGFLSRKRTGKVKAKAYSRYSGGRAGYKQMLRGHKYYGSIGKAKGKFSGYY